MKNRTVKALLLALVVGATVMLLSNALIYVQCYCLNKELLTGFWGLVNGSWSALVTFGLALGIRPRGRVSATLGWAIAALTLAFVGSSVWTWMTGWGGDPPWWQLIWTLEGAWMFPLTVVTLSGALYSAVRAWKTARGKLRPRNELRW